MERGQGGEANILLAWLIICIIIGAAAILYLSVGHNASHGDMLVMPLDDVYIHFQYARMFAAGQPFRYNPGDPPTSGATSLLYPILLAVGYVIGFQGDRLALWAVGIGVLSWIGSTWLIFRIVYVRRLRPTFWIALLIALAFAFSGGISWAFVSGMETGLMIFATLLTLWYMTCRDLWGTILAAIFAAVIRPEGLVIAIGAMLFFAFRLPRRRWPILLLPLLAGLIQPLLNLILTDSATASGMQAKSYLYNVPFDWGVLVNNIISVIVRVWREQLTGIDIDGVIYSTGLLFLIALAYIFIELCHSTRRGAGLPRPFWSPAGVIIFWLLGLTAAVSILETAFWQFKRYQQPIFALLFVLAGWGLTTLLQRLPRLTIIPLLAAAALLIFSFTTFVPFVTYYGDNINEVASMQIPMARYVASITAPGTRIGVHDIGVMRYIGDRPTYDVVGLTTPGAARAWRNGPGAVYEAMRASPYRPKYFAIYDEPHGLSYFLYTDVFSFVNTTIDSTEPPHNVASAGHTQVVAFADWSRLQYDNDLFDPLAIKASKQLSPVDSINVAYLDEEDRHAYRWWQSVERPGFATEFYQMTTAEHLIRDLPDSGRLITGGEEMIISTRPNEDLLWVTRVHPRDEANLTLFVDGQPVATRVQPGGNGGEWIEISTLIPRRFITRTETRLRTEVASTDGFYMPYYHWFYQGHYQANTIATLPGPNVDFGDGITLVGRRIGIESHSGRPYVEVEWLGSPAKMRHDAKVFVHVYSNPNQPPVAQFDGRPGSWGTLPPANWLPDILHEAYYVDKPLSPGIYTIAIGLYDPTTNQRLTVTGEGADKDNRLFIGTIMVGL